jgi:glycosyltransferase involved in cell wall biosynthesis
MISISISSYNQSEWLRDAIESALGQSSEIICVDDGSTDNSLEIARSYEPQIKVISQVNKGLSSARNTGIMNAIGDYILFLDADDILMPNCIEVMERVIKETNADIIAPSFKNFGLYNNEVNLTQCTHADFMTANRIGYFSAIRKSKLLEIGGYSPRMTFGFEDYHIWHNLLCRGATLQVLKDILVLYRTKPNSMLTTANEHQEELLNQINKDFYAKS